MASLSTIGNQLKREADNALERAAVTDGPIEKRAWLEVAAEAIRVYERILALRGNSAAREDDA